MDPNRPWKIVRCPLPLGVCAGLVGEVIDEYPDEGTARAMMYGEHREDESPVKGLYYTYDVVLWDGTMQLWKAPDEDKD